MTDQAKLIDAARKAAAHAYAPYSHFAVGAALLLDDGRIVTGCNFENASYGLALCAETVALAKANSDGDLARVKEIAVIGGSIANGAMAGSDPVRPCGRCRQVINEAAQLGARDIVVHCSSADGATVETHRMSNLLPYAFGPADLA
jgi:cytidine deaminase